MLRIRSNERWIIQVLNSAGGIMEEFMHRGWLDIEALKRKYTNDPIVHRIRFIQA